VLHRLVDRPKEDRGLCYSAHVGGFAGVLFDFGHTLFDSTSADEYVAQFGMASGQRIDPADFAATWANIRERSRQPDELAKGRDLSADAHRRCWLDLLAPLDELATGLARFAYEYECSSKGWRPYPDAKKVLEVLREREIPVGVVSDCGWDIRDVFLAHRLEELVDSFDLSYEHGICKPARQLFASACSKLHIDPSRTLMVGDSWLTDGGAAALGITTLILPARDRTEFPALSPILDLVS